MKLENGNNGKWKFSEKTWFIPEEQSHGSIKDYSTGLVLGHVGDGTDSVVLQEESNPLSDGQIWTRSTYDEDGFFTLKNPSSGRVLTSSSITSITAKGMQIFGQYLNHDNNNLIACSVKFNLHSRI